MARKSKKDEVAELKRQLLELQTQLVARTAEKVPVVDPDEDTPRVKLDLGGGESPREGFASVDAYAPGAAHQVDLWSGARWPFDDGSVDELHSSHTIEHIDASRIMTYHPGDGIDALIFFFTEAFRILKPGGKFTVVWPALQNVRAFMDPTHRRFIPRETMLYLDAEWRKANKLDHYLTGGLPLDFKCVSAQPSIPETEATKPDVVQQQNANDHWNFFQDWMVVLQKPAA